MKPLNLALCFALELCMLAALAVWSFSENTVLGVVAPVAAAAVWGLWIALKATRRLRDPVRPPSNCSSSAPPRLRSRQPGMVCSLPCSPRRLPSTRSC